MTADRARGAVVRLLLGWGAAALAAAMVLTWRWMLLSDPDNLYHPEAHAAELRGIRAALLLIVVAAVGWTVKWLRAARRARAV